VCVLVYVTAGTDFMKKTGQSGIMMVILLYNKSPEKTRANDEFI